MTLKTIDTMLIIITEASIENPLTNEIMNLGATGYTVSEVHGRGDRGVRNNELFEISNIKDKNIVEKNSHNGRTGGVCTSTHMSLLPSISSSGQISKVITISG